MTTPSVIGSARAAKLTRVGRLFIAVMLVVVLEGAVRKWVSAGLTLPLILLRDSLALYAIYYAFINGHLHRQKNLSAALLAWSCCVLGWGMLQIVLQESTPLVLLVGLRFWLLYIWFAFAVSASMTEHDYRSAIRVVLVALLMMSLLVVAQHFSPPGAFINTEVDSNEDEIFLVAVGVVRTTGTFSFTLGFTTFMALCAPLVMLAIEAQKRNHRQRFAALLIFIAFVIGSAVSGSRSTVIFSGAILGSYVLGNLLVAPGSRKGPALLSAIVIVLTLCVFLYVFQDAVDATQERFEAAADAEDFVDRLLTMFIGEPAVYKAFSWLGSGLGLGSNLANYVTTGDRGMFRLAETEAGRTLLEGGLLGYLYIALKIFVIVAAFTKGIALAVRTKLVYPVVIWLTIGVALLTWPSIGQLSVNAFFGILVVFGLLAFKYPKLKLFA